MRVKSERQVEELLAKHKAEGERNSASEYNNNTASTKAAHHSTHETTPIQRHLTHLPLYSDDMSKAALVKEIMDISAEVRFVCVDLWNLRGFLLAGLF